MTFAFAVGICSRINISWPTGGIFGSIFVVCPLNTLIITDYHSHERPNHGRSFDVLVLEEEDG